MDVPEIADRLASGGEATDAELAALITAEGDDREAVFAAARRVRDREFGKRTFLYGFVYFSTYCRNECSFCYYRKSNSIDRYRKTEDEIVDLARSIRDSGINLADLTMGEDPFMIRNGYENFIHLVSTICDEVGIPVMASPGAVPEGDFPKLRDAGADIVACYQETYNRALFADRRLGQDFDYRRNQKVWAMRNGMLAEDGMMVGIGETVEDRVHAIREMIALGCDQVRAMTFVPQEGTPMELSGTVDSVNELLCLSAMRLLRHDVLIPATLDVEGIAGMRTRLDAGANVVTSIIPPASHLAGVAQSSMDIEDGHRCADYVISLLKEIGREPATATDLRREFDRRKARLSV
ncbi:MAG: methylornithine synthase PylB [Thermoplasmata archaeon]|nr:methylornithine synthase PylB [Thermoplasmata archaeon]